MLNAVFIAEHTQSVTASFPVVVVIAPVGQAVQLAEDAAAANVATSAA